MSLKKEYFGEMPDGREVSLYTITNKNGLEASITLFSDIETKRNHALCDLSFQKYRYIFRIQSITQSAICTQFFVLQTALCNLFF